MACDLPKKCKRSQAPLSTSHNLRVILKELEAECAYRQVAQGCCAAHEAHPERQAVGLTVKRPSSRSRAIRQGNLSSSAVS